MPSRHSPRQLDAVGAALSAVRRVKSEAKVSMKAEVATARVTGDADLVALVEEVSVDLRNAGNIRDLAFAPTSGEVSVEATLAP